MRKIKYLPVVPVEIHERALDYCMLDTFYGAGIISTNIDIFLLAHEVVLKRLKYEELFNKSPFIDIKRINIKLDNSVIELGTTNYTMIFEAVQILKKIFGDRLCLTIIAPDVLMDYDKTIKAITSMLNKIPEDCHNDKFMFVPQGKNYEEWLDCFEDIIKLIENSNIKIPSNVVIGIPKNLVLKGLVTSRLDVISTLYYNKKFNAYNDRVKFHLLGFTDNREDDMLCAIQDCVESIDSSVPIKDAYMKTVPTMDIYYKIADEDRYATDKIWANDFKLSDELWSNFYYEQLKIESFIMKCNI